MAVKKRLKGFHKMSAAPYMFILPAVLLIIFFYAYPLLQTIYMAFFNYDILNPGNNSFAGFANFTRTFEDPIMSVAIKNTIVWVVVSLAFQFILGFILALLLWRNFKGKGIYQSAVFIPWAISGFLIGIVFRWMFNAQFGVISDILGKLGLMQSKISILSLPGTAMIGPITGLVWYGVPFFAIMILASLQGVSEEMLEAADMDGAGRVTKLFKIILPIIKPTIVVTLLLRVIWIFNSADIIYVMTNGGPANSTQTLATFLFQKAYTNLDFSLVSVISLCLIAFLTVYTVIYLAISKFEEAGDMG